MVGGVEGGGWSCLKGGEKWVFGEGVVFCFVDREMSELVRRELD